MKHGTWRGRGWRVGASLVSLSIALLMLATPAPHSAVAAGSWSKPVVVFSTSGYTNNPVLVADPTGDVHLIVWYKQDRGNRGNPGSSRGTLLYARLRRGVWSKPVDVQESPDGVAQTSAAVDKDGYLHVVWLAPNVHQIYYSRAHLSQADSAPAWSKPVPLSDTDASNGAFAEDNDIASSGGTLHFLHTAGGRVIYRRSDDGGRTWAPPTTVADASNQNAAPDDPRVVVDASGRVFATWTQYSLPDGWPPTGTYLARSVDGGNTWSQPARIAGTNRALLAPVTDGQTRLYLMWLSVSGVGETGGLWSEDGGQTWSTPERILPTLGVGLSGFPRMAFDSRGILHLALTAALDQKTAGIFTAYWDRHTWSPQTLVSHGSIGKESIEEPTLAISQGNQIHVAWEDDFQRIWYTSQLVDAPSVPAAPLPPLPLEPADAITTPLPVVTQAVTVVVPTSTPLPADAAASTASPSEVVQTNSQPMPPLVAAGFISLLLIGAVAVIHLRRLR